MMSVVSLVDWIVLGGVNIAGIAWGLYYLTRCSRK
jgi:hypothetical protein